jgi:hypothetical protein
MQKRHYYTNDESSLVLRIDYITFYNDKIKMIVSLFAKPNGRLVDQCEITSPNTNDWTEYDNLNDALKHGGSDDVL